MKVDLQPQQRSHLCDCDCKITLAWILPTTAHFQRCQRSEKQSRSITKSKEGIMGNKTDFRFIGALDQRITLLCAHTAKTPFERKAK